jgi:transposase
MVVSKKQAKRPRGQPKIELSENDISQIEALAAHGHSQKEICKWLGFSETTLKKMRKRDVEISDSYIKGKMKALSFASSKLMKYIKSDDQSALNLKAIMYYLDTQGWYLKRITPDTDIDPDEVVKEIEVSFLQDSVIDTDEFNK